MSSHQKHIIIIGNGIAGITAARHIRKLSRHTITVISAESDYFFARTALMYVYMGHLRWKDIMPYEPWFWTKNKINLVKDFVTAIDDHHKSIRTSSGTLYTYDQLIIATGSLPNTMPIEGSDANGVSGLHTLQDLEYIEAKSKNIRQAVIIGGGLIGVELAEMFHSRKIKVTHLVRENGYAASILPPEESNIVCRHIREHDIDLRLQTEISKINCSPTGKVVSVTTTIGETIHCQLVGMATGVKPNINWLVSSNLKMNKGILVDSALRTNLPDIFAIGDCAELQNPGIGRKAIEPVWYTGRLMGETVAKTICDSETTYQPGTWFNSAKFFDIEYQSYGDIRPNLPKDQKTFYWQNEMQTKSLRINFTPQGVIGINVLGLRLRQEVCHLWIETHCSLETVLANLEKAVFDAEFSKTYSQYVRDVFELQTGKKIRKEGNGGYNQVYHFLKNPKRLSI